ncbi:sn-glycerol-3-phosphate ABC transporter substrate-binding protein UgpB [Marinomonas posidonica]|uniref:sn-glycerol-3-phosphate-binding periplasmic protein UgpB n=1 Tax=Marinomonas posidonica (strain CECT 7376 / NCIMB 14433 / IVIA-Po-181) TaxID=491952 RepID=F6CRX2_MARPP|nr:sn-glycerol-3-phosphate ABC transporter substrate-binding protein UgpB [Marinomonas posidonica]AEF56079.1 extracellular solute-binding protein family 1 [Marinomonas posidonica IVIA-Po-181]
MYKLKLASAVIGFSIASSGFAATNIEWWHAMGGANGEKVNEIAKAFNDSQDAYTVKPVYKGNYTETMTSAIAAFRAKKQPHIVQVFEVGTASMMSAKGAIYPVYELMRESGQSFDQSGFLSAVTGYYSDQDGNMLSMPFNSSTPVLYYNKDLFAKAGIKNPPTTWEEMESVSQTLLDNGVKCGFTTAWQSWVQLENFSARHNVPFASEANGFGGLDTKLTFNGSLQVAHIEKMGEWQQNGIFSYGGRRSDSAPKFYSQECAMFMNSSAGYAGIKKNAKFDFGVSQLPYQGSAISEPKNTIIGGASLWVLQGHKKEEYKGVASFLSFLSRAEVQADWHQFSGYLPITRAAYDLTKGQGFYAQNVGTETGVLQMTSGTPTPNSKGLRLGNFVQIRDIINEELESVWAGQKSAQAALDEAVKRGDVLLRKFERANK